MHLPFDLKNVLVEGSAFLLTAVSACRILLAECDRLWDEFRKFRGRH